MGYSKQLAQVALRSAATDTTGWPCWQDNCPRQHPHPNPLELPGGTSVVGIMQDPSSAGGTRNSVVLVRDGDSRCCGHCCCRGFGDAVIHCGGIQVSKVPHEGTTQAFA